MTIVEKITIQNQDSSKIFLFKEGVFWVAYEQSAYFIAKYKKYKATIKQYKNIKQSIVSVGFPKVEVVLNELLLNKCINKVIKTDAVIEIVLNQSIDSSVFELWKIDQTKEKQENLTPKMTVEQLVKAFPLANKTPMEAFLFLKLLQDN